VSFWQQFLADDQGQDMVEYALLLAFVCLVGAAAFLGIGASVNTIWGFANQRLANANCTSNCVSGS
jgi:Flp pilus assembly pilin Flp